MDSAAVAFRAQASGAKRSPGNRRANRMPQRRRHRRSHCCRCLDFAGMRDGSGAAETRRSNSCKTTEVTGAMLLPTFRLWIQVCNPNSCNQVWARFNRRPSLREHGVVVKRKRSSSGVDFSAASSSCVHCTLSVVSNGRCFCRKAMAASGSPGANQCTRQAVCHKASPIRESPCCLRRNNRSSRATSSKLFCSTCKRLPESMRSADIPSPLVLGQETWRLCCFCSRPSDCHTQGSREGSCRRSALWLAEGSRQGSPGHGKANRADGFLSHGKGVCSERSGSVCATYDKRNQFS